MLDPSMTFHTYRLSRWDLPKQDLPGRNVRSSLIRPLRQRKGGSKTQTAKTSDLKKKNVPEKNHTEIQEKECSRTQNRKQGQRKDGISNKKEIFTSKETIRLWKKYQGNNANQKPYGTTNHEMGRNTWKVTSRMDNITTIQKSIEKDGSRRTKSSLMDGNTLNLPLQDMQDVGRDEE